MGLDQYAYCRAKKEGSYSDSREIAYWRKHPNLQGWMENLWAERYPDDYNSEGPDTFNGIELELTWEDLERLEKDLVSGTMAELKKTGFFFGDESDYYYREHDLEFIRNAKAELFMGLKVFYNSSW